MIVVCLKVTSSFWWGNPKRRRRRMPFFNLSTTKPIFSEIFLAFLSSPSMPATTTAQGTLPLTLMLKLSISFSSQAVDPCTNVVTICGQFHEPFLKTFWWKAWQFYLDRKLFSFVCEVALRYNGFLKLRPCGQPCSSGRCKLEGCWSSDWLPNIAHPCSKNEIKPWWRLSIVF